MDLKKIIGVFCLFILSLYCMAQDPKYPQGYFQWPVGAEFGLAANFGELRPNHFHMGLDCRTNQRENLPVYAAAAGYIAKVKIEPGGFGRAIYINHPNGLTTLYAHLNDFFPQLEAYVKREQYRLEQWNVFLDIPPDMFPVKKGMQIAKSGNTGGSQGPHLHFEIRDTRSDKVLNPLLFGFPVKDNIPPSIIRLAVYDRCQSIYEQSPRFIPLKNVNGIFMPVAGVLTINTDRISFGITAFDRYTGSSNQNGIYKASVWDNNVLQTEFVMDSISYDETRYLNAHIDYKTKSTGGSYIQHLSKLPGYEDGIYRGPANGVINLEDEQVHTIRINVYDAAGNVSRIQLNVQAGEKRNTPPPPAGILFSQGDVNVFENEQVRFFLSEKHLYDTFHFTYSVSKRGEENVYQLHNPSVPLHQYFTVNLRPSISYADTGKVLMRRFHGAKEDFADATYSQGWYSAKFREFGNFELIYDDTPPVISPVSITAKRIMFTITDNSKGLKKFRPLLNGKWIRFSNDKGRTFIYDFDEMCPPGNNTLVISVEDLAGNKSERTINFNHK